MDGAVKKRRKCAECGVEEGSIRAPRVVALYPVKFTSEDGRTSHRHLCAMCMVLTQPAGQA